MPDPITLTGAVSAIGTLAGGAGSLISSFKANNSTNNTSDQPADWYAASVASILGAQNTGMTQTAGELALAQGGDLGAKGLQAKTEAALQSGAAQTTFDYATQTNAAEISNAANTANSALGLDVTAADLKNAAERGVTTTSQTNAADYSKAVSELAATAQQGINTVANTEVAQTGNLGATHDTNLSAINTAGVNAAGTVATQGVAQTGALQNTILGKEGDIAVNNAATVNAAGKEALSVQNQYALAAGQAGLDAQKMGLAHEYALQAKSADTKNAINRFTAEQNKRSALVFAAQRYFNA